MVVAGANFRRKLCTDKPMLRFGAAPFVVIFVVLSSLVALFAFFLA